MRFVFEKRQSVSRQALVLAPVGSFFVSLLLGAILLLASKVNPLTTYAAMAHGAFGSWYNFSETLVKAIPLMLTGLGVSIAFRMRFWNIGAEGQLVWGGVAAAWVIIFLADVIPPWLLLPAALLRGVVGPGI